MSTREFDVFDINIFKGRITTADKFVVPPDVHFAGTNVVVGLDGNITKLPAPVAMHSGLGNINSILSSYSFRQATLSGHWWLYDAGDSTYAIDQNTGAEYLLRSGQSTGATWMTTRFNNVIYRTNSAASEMILYTSAASGTQAKLWGMISPTAAPGITTAAGSINAAYGFILGYAFRDSVTGHVSGMSPISAVTGALASKKITLTSLPTSGPARADQLVFFGTFDGLYDTVTLKGDMYLLEDASGNMLTKAINATTTYDITNWAPNPLIPAPYYNQPPPAAKYCLRYQDRIFLWGLANKNEVKFSTYESVFIGTREECFPAGFNTIPIPEEVTALGICPTGLLIFAANNMYMLAGQVRDTMPGGSRSAFGSSNLNIPNIGEQLITLPFSIGTISPYTVVNSNKGDAWFLSNDGKVYSYNGQGMPQEQSALIRPDMSALDSSKRFNFRATWFGYGDRQGYALLCQRKV